MRGNIGNNAVFRRAEQLEHVSHQTATTRGVGIKTIILVGISLISALLTMFVFGPLNILPLYIVIWVVTFIMVLFITFRPTMARVLAIPYAILEGMAVGAISGVVAIALPEVGLLVPALALTVTLAIFLGASVLYTTGIIKVTNFFRRFMYTLLIGVLLTSLIVAIAGLFNSEIYQLFYGADSALALLLSIIMVVIASLYVVISLDNATRIIDASLDAVYEWYAAFGILLNVIWLYYEVLRLIMILFVRNRD